MTTVYAVATVGGAREGLRHAQPLGGGIDAPARCGATVRRMDGPHVEIWGIDPADLADDDLACPDCIHAFRMWGQG